MQHNNEAAIVVPGKAESSKGKRVALVLAAVLPVALVAGEANAASVIDATMKAALESGFGDLIDTMKDVIGTSWPFVIGAAVLMAAPTLVLKLIGKATGR